MSLRQHSAEQVPNRYGLQGDFRGESLMTPLRSILQITLWHGIWRIRLDGEFFGDYRSKSHALEAANTAQRAMAETGRIAEVANDAGRESVLGDAGTWPRKRATNIEFKAH